MGQIYANSSQTVVWLGRAENGSNIVMDFMNEIGKETAEYGLLQHHPHEVTDDWSTNLVAEDDPNKSMKQGYELLYQRV
jgi:hypothetical protein